MKYDSSNQTVYNYQDWRHGIFTEEGQVVFLKIRDNAQRLLKVAGAFKHTYAYTGITSDNYTMAACIDRLVELGEIVEVTRDTAWPDRVFIEVKYDYR